MDEAVDDVRVEVEGDEDSVPEKTDSERFCSAGLPAVVNPLIVMLRRSTRSRKPPDRCGFNVA